MLPKIWKFQGVLESVHDLSPDVRHFVFSCPKDFTFTAGQFVTAVLQTPEGRQLRRSYSIASVPSLEGKIELCIKLVEGGQGSKIFFDLSVGDTIEFMGPLGHFTLKNDSVPLVFIGTGTGISPYRSMIPPLLESGFDKEIVLLAGSRHHMLYEQEWRELHNKYENFTLHSVMSRPRGEFDGHTGRVTDLVEKYAHPEGEEEYYLCGLNEMIQEVGKLLSKSGVATSRIHFERYN